MIRFAILVLLGSMGCAAQVYSQDPMFAAGAPVIVGPGSGTVILADVSGAGHLDLVTRHLLSRSVRVQVGDGMGGLTAATNPIVFPYPPGDLKLGDVNNDKILDMVVTSSETDIVDIFLGTGRGGFALTSGSPLTVSTSVDIYNKRTLHLVDLNEDGNLDILTANGRRRSACATLLGDGRGGFSPGPIVRLDAGRDGYTFAFGDIDGDGHLDAVTASTGTDQDPKAGRVAVQRGDGRGNFGQAIDPPLSVAPGPGYVALADVNGDLRLDIVISHSNNLLSVLLNAGNGRFAPALASPYHLGEQAFALIVADINRDQKPDLVAATVNSVTVLLGDNGRFAPAPGSPFRAGPGAYYLTVGDLNEDGKLDVVASSFESNAITVLLGR